MFLSVVRVVIFGIFAVLTGKVVVDECRVVILRFLQCAYVATFLECTSMCLLRVRMPVRIAMLAYFQRFKSQSSNVCKWSGNL